MSVENVQLKRSNLLNIANKWLNHFSRQKNEDKIAVNKQGQSRIVAQNEMTRENLKPAHYTLTNTFVKPNIASLFTCLKSRRRVTSWMTSSATFSGKNLNLNWNFFLGSFLTFWTLIFLSMRSQSSWFWLSVNWRPKYHSWKKESEKTCLTLSLYCDGAIAVAEALKQLHWS